MDRSSITIIDAHEGFRNLLAQAEQETGRPLEPMVKEYLHELLPRFLCRAHITSAILGEAWLRAHAEQGLSKWHALQEIGDQSLMIAGLFPGLAEKRHVSLGYYVALGQEAYGLLKAQHGVYEVLSRDFHDIVHTLDGLRGQEDFNLLDERAVMSRRP